MTQTTPKPPPPTDYCHKCQKWAESIEQPHASYDAGQGSWTEMEYTDHCPICGGEVDKYEATP